MTSVRLARLGYIALRGLQARRGPVPLAGVRNFLLMQHHQALGPSVAATAFVRALHATLPDARIVIAASGFSHQLFSNHPAVEQLLSAPDPRHDLRGAVSALRRANFFSGEPFVALLTTGTAIGKTQLAAYLAGAQATLGVVHAQAQPGAFLTASPSTHEDATGKPASLLLRYDRKLSRIGNDLQLIHRLGHSAELGERIRRDPDIQQPRIFPGEAAFASASALLADRGLADQCLADQGIVSGKPFAALITQTRSDPTRSWPAESFREMAVWLHRQYGMQIVFTGTVAEASAIDALRAPLDVPTANLAGRTSLQELAAVLATAAIGIGFDTGTMHIARAVDLPLVVIAAPTAPPIDWLPLGHPRARIVYSAVRPPHCDYPIPGELSITEVQENARALLAAYPPAEGWRSPATDEEEK